MCILLFCLSTAGMVFAVDAATAKKELKTFVDDPNARYIELASDYNVTYIFLNHVIKLGADASDEKEIFIRTEDNYLYVSFADIISIKYHDGVLSIFVNNDAL